MKPPLTRQTALPAALFLLSACSSVDPEMRAAERFQELPVPEAERVTADVLWLADDAREGRRAGTAGERSAAEWIAARLGSLGLEPAGSDGYLQPFEVQLPARDGGASTVSYDVPQGDGRAIGAVVGDPNRLVPLFCSAAGRAQGPVVFGGYGIVAPELEWDDYGERDLTGAVVVVVRGTPPDDAAPAAEEAEAPDAPDAPDATDEVENPHGAAAPSTSRWAATARSSTR